MGTTNMYQFKIGLLKSNEDIYLMVLPVESQNSFNLCGI